MSTREIKKGSAALMAAEFEYSNELSFHEAFPEIEDVCIMVTEAEGSVKADIEKPATRLADRRVYGKNIGECIECHSPFCVDGGFSIRKILRPMVRIHNQFMQGTILCSGSEGAMKTNRKYLPCNRSFQFTVSVTYKDEADSSLGVGANQITYKNHKSKSKAGSSFKNISPPAQQPLPD